MASCTLTEPAIAAYSHLIEVKWPTSGCSYDLQELFDEYGFVPKPADYVLLHGNTTTEYPIALWIMNIIENSADLGGTFIHVNYMVALPISFHNMLTPLLSSLPITPDTSLRIEVEGKEMTFFITEMHSGKLYKNSLCKSIANSVDLFRFIRVYNEDIENVTSFVFPKFGCASRVTKVVVSFNASLLRMKVICTEIPVENVKYELLNALKEMIRSVQRIAVSSHQHHSCFLKLNTKELKEFETKLNTSNLKQRMTSNSLVFHNTRMYWKLVIRPVQAAMCTTVSGIKCKHVIKYTPTIFPCVLSSPALSTPLSHQEIQVCMKDFLKLVKTALDALHSINFVHLDVRVPNICFKISSGTCIAVLIDLDRAQSAMDSEVNPGYEVHEFYKKPSNWKLELLDFKQLAMTVQKILRIEDQFLKQLEDEGK